mmetsp:Transcript_76738/g.211998  ORF Transcript_76738/g.211998 Transcript_76738/m.211998 type:complete len:324 (+) Transcript_76738:558-1529(+)
MTSSCKLRRQSGQFGLRSNHGRIQVLWKKEEQPCDAHGIETVLLCLQSKGWQQMAHSWPTKASREDIACFHSFNSFTFHRLGHSPSAANALGTSSTPCPSRGSMLLRKATTLRTSWALRPRRSGSSEGARSELGAPLRKAASWRNWERRTAPRCGTVTSSWPSPTPAPGAAAGLLARCCAAVGCWTAGGPERQEAGNCVDGRNIGRVAGGDAGRGTCAGGGIAALTATSGGPCNLCNNGWLAVRTTRNVAALRDGGPGSASESSESSPMPRRDRAWPAPVPVPAPTPRAAWEGGPGGGGGSGEGGPPGGGSGEGSLPGGGNGA